MAIPAPDTRIGFSKPKLALMAFGCLLFSLFCGAMGFLSISDPDVGDFRKFALWAGALLFAVGCGLSAWRLVNENGDVVTMTDASLTDTRVAREPIPWLAVRRIGTYTIRRQKGITLALDPKFEARLNLTWIARWSRGGNTALGVDGLCVTAAGLTISHDQLLKEMTARWTAARNAASPHTPV